LLYANYRSSIVMSRGWNFTEFLKIISGLPEIKLIVSLGSYCSKVIKIEISPWLFVQFTMYVRRTDRRPSMEKGIMPIFLSLSCQKNVHLSSVYTSFWYTVFCIFAMLPALRVAFVFLVKFFAYTNICNCIMSWS
jgi:hypothetical protein